MIEDETIVAGAGLWGCTIARRLAEAGRKVQVLEKRATVGGNVRCEIDAETGIEIHAYGSHIFHTHDRQVWDFVRRFTEFNGYQHKVLASYRGKLYHLPLGLALVNKFFGVELKPNEVETFLSEPVRKKALFDAFFRGYTSKQWGRPPEEIDPSVIKRIPVRSNYDANYFNDYWQGIPSDGYNALFDRLLDHPNITVRCNAVFDLNQTVCQAGSRVTYYSGPIDALFGYKFGALPWRSLRFEVERLDVADYQGTSVINYPEAEVPYTRIHEFKHYHPDRRSGSLTESTGAAGKTVIMREYPKSWELGDEPYYPVNNPDSAALLAKYQSELAALNSRLLMSKAKLVCGGRLGAYCYYDMDQAVSAALALELG